MTTVPPPLRDSLHLPLPHSQRASLSYQDSIPSVNFCEQALILPNMSGFLSPDAEAALLGEDDARRFFSQGRSRHVSPAASMSASTSYPEQQWPSSGYPSMSYPASQASYPTYGAPSQYMSWPTSSLAPLHESQFAPASYAPNLTPVVPSTPYGHEQWPNAPWPALHPDDYQNDASSTHSRSVSPNPADLHNFGILLADGKSWKCAFPDCTSQARFTRGCDLRKHYRRHKKSLFCRHDDCPQSKVGGFSSKKDRDRHKR